jgi:glycosyltransferase involved in cell wall biosynthesis
VVKNVRTQTSIIEECPPYTLISSESDASKGISVLIPTYSPDIDDIREILCSLSNQQYPTFEVIIANDGVDFYSHIQDIVKAKNPFFQYRNNNQHLGLYGSIKENMKYCQYENILVLEQDIVPLNPQYLSSLVALMEASPANVVTSKLVIASDTDFKKYIFYKRRISNLGVFDRENIDLSSNCAEETEIAFTKADLLNKSVLSELFSKGSTNVFTAQDIILTSIVHEDKKLVTSDATACEIGLRDPNKLMFFLKKEFLYGKSVLDALRHSNKDWLQSTSYFKEKASRVLFLAIETFTLLALAVSLLLGISFLQVPLLAFDLGLAVVYSQAVLARIGFWRFWRHGSRRLTGFLASGVVVILLDVAYALGILRRLI